MFGLGTLTPRARGPKNRVPGSIQLRQWKAFPGLVDAAGLGFAAGLDLKRGFKFAASVKTVSSKAR